MSVLQESQIETSVYSCNFQCFIRQANISMKFPCSYFVEWRTLNSKIIVQTNKHSPQDGFTVFDEKLTINVQMLYEHGKLEFVKRDTIIELYLISRSRPDQNKLVGRVTIDLAKVINVGMYEEPTEFKLNFSSVGGVLIMQFKALDRRLTTLALQDLDKSSFLDFVSQTAFKGPARAQSMIQSHYQGANSSQRGNREARAVSPINNTSKSAIKKSILVNKDSFVRGSYDTGQERRQEGIIHNYTNIPLNSTIKQKVIPSQKQQLLVQPPKQKQIEKQSVAKQIIFSDSVEKLEPVQPAINHLTQEQNFIKTSSAPIFQKIPSQNQQTSNEIRRTANNNTQVKDNQENRSLLMHEREQLSVYTKQNEDLKIELQRWRGKSNESQSSKNRLQQLNVELNDKVLHEKNVNKELLEQISKKNKIIGEFDHELTQKQSMIAILEAKISSFTEKQKSVLNNSEGLKKQNGALLQKIQQLLKNLELHQKNVVFYQQKCEKYEAKIKKSTQIQKQLNNKLKNLIQTEHQLKTRNQQLQIQNNGLVNSLQEYRKMMQQKMHGQGINDDDRYNLQQEVNHYKVKMEETVDKFQQLSKQLSFVTEKYMELQSLYDDQVKISENLQSQLTELETQNINPVEGNISEVIEVVQKGQQTIHLLRVENDQLKKQIQVVKTKKSELQLKAKAQAQLFSLEINNLKAQINALQKNILQLQQMNDNLQKYNQSIENQLAQKQQITKENDFLKQQIDNLSLQIDQLNREIQQMGENQLQNHRVSGLQQLQQQNKELRQQYKGVEGQIQFYQKQLLILKDEIISIRQARSSRQNISTKQNEKQLQVTEEKIKEYEDVIAKLNNNYEEQIYQNNELSETIMRYMDKEAKMKQTLQILEKESKEIFNLVQEKEQNQESYRRAIEELQQQIVKLKSKEAEQKTPTKPQNQTPLPNYQYSPNVSNNDLIRLQGEKEQLQVANLQLKHLNEKLNSELMSLNFQFNQKKSVLQSQISQLTQKLSSLQNTFQKEEQSHSNKIKQCDKNYRAKDMQVQIWKSRAKNYEQQKTSVQNEFNRLKTTLQQIQEQKFILQSSINEKQIKIMEMQEEINLLLNQITQFQQLAPINKQPRYQVSSNKDLFVQLKEKLFSKTLQNDWQSLIQSVLQRSMTAQQTSKLINLQQKSRLLSKQLQKIKSQLLKSQWRNNQQKITLMSLFKKCDSTVSELISAAQSLNQNQSSFL